MSAPSSFRGSSGDLLVEGARQHNLRNISLRIPHDAVTAITGVSGSGKSSLAFDTLFAEGQWRYLESLSIYARMFLERLDRPDVDRVVNIRPAIAIEQKNTVRSTRSTVATATEIADLLRLLFAKVGRPTCPDCRQEVRSYHPAAITDELLSTHPNGRAMVLFPVRAPDPGHERGLVDSLLSRGYARIKCGQDLLDLQSGTALPDTGCSVVHVVLDRLILRQDNRVRLNEAVELALREGQGSCRVEVIGESPLMYSTFHPLSVPRMRPNLRAAPSRRVFLQPSPWRMPGMQGVRQSAALRRKSDHSRPHALAGSRGG